MTSPGYAKYFIKPTTTTTQTPAQSTDQAKIDAIKAAVVSDKTNPLMSIATKQRNAARVGLNIDDYNKFEWLDKIQQTPQTQQQTSSQTYTSKPQEPKQQQQTQKTTTTYDLMNNFKDVQAQAKKYGVSVALPKTTSYKNQTDAQKALDAYVAATNKALEAKINKDNAAAAAKSQSQTASAPVTRGYYDGLTPTQRNEVDSWNTNNKARGINDAINPDWVVWRNEKLSGPEPSRYWKDVTSNSPSARDAYQARMDAEHAESQRQLAEAYVATQKAAGTTHAKSTVAITNNGKSASQIQSEQKNVKTSTSKLQIVSAKSVAPSVAAKQIITVKDSKPIVTIQEKIKQNSQVKQTTKAVIIPTNTSVTNNTTGIKGSNSSAKFKRAVVRQEAKTGKVMLGDGTWVAPIQITGAANPNSGKITKFTESTKEHYQNALKSSQTISDQYNKLRFNFSEVKLKDGTVVPTIQSHGNGGTGKDSIRIIKTDKSGNVTAISGTGREYADIIKQQQAQQRVSNEQEVKSLPTKTGIHDAEWDREIALNDAQQKSSNPIVRTLAKLDRTIGEYTMGLATNAATGASLELGRKVSDADLNYLNQSTNSKNPIMRIATKADVKAAGALMGLVENAVTGAKLANGEKVSDSDLTYMKKTTGIGTDKTHSNFVNGISTKYGESTIFNENSIQNFAGTLKNLEGAVAGGIVNATPTPIRDTIGSVSNRIKDNNSNGFTTFAGNVVRSIESADEIVPNIIIAANGLPKVAVGALKESETLARNPGYILPTVAYAAGNMVAGTAKSAYENPVETAAYFAAQDIALKGTLKTLETTVSSVGRGTGVVRDKTVVIKNAPYHPVESQGALIDAVISNDKISGTRGTQVHYLYQQVSRTDGVAPVGIDTFKVRGKEYTLGSILRKLQGEHDQTLTRFMTEGGTAKGHTYPYANEVHTSYMVPDLTKGHFESVGGHFLQKGSGSRLKQNVQILEDIPTVASELTEAQKTLIRSQYAANGRLDPSLLTEIQKLAEAKSARIHQPVATITPKTAGGWYKPESEVLLVFGDKASTTITSKKWAGYTSQGIKINKIRFGSQEAIGKNLALLENLKYNWGNILSGKGEYVKGMAVQQNRKLSELAGDALYKPNQYGPHGPTHINPVVENIEKIWKSSPELQTKYTLQEFKVAARLHDTGRVFGSSKLGETEPIAHGPAVAKSIRRGLLKDKELLSLPRASQLRIADAIETHMTIRPLTRYSIGNGLKTSILTRPSDFQKALANADRLARASKAGYIKNGMIFKLPEETARFKLKSAIGNGIDDVSKSRIMSDTSAELLPGRSVTRMKSMRRIDDNVTELRSALPKLERSEKLSRIKESSMADEYAIKPKSRTYVGGIKDNYTMKSKSGYGEYPRKTRYTRSLGYQQSQYSKSTHGYKSPSYTSKTTQHGYRNVSKVDKRSPITQPEYELNINHHTRTPILYDGRVRNDTSPIITPVNRGYAQKSQVKQNSGYANITGSYVSPKVGSTYHPSSGNNSYGGSNGSGSTGGYGGGGDKTAKNDWFTGVRKRKGTEILVPKKSHKNTTYVKKDKDMAKIKRTIFNKLGGLESMLG